MGCSLNFPWNPYFVYFKRCKILTGIGFMPFCYSAATEKSSYGTGVLNILLIRKHFAFWWHICRYPASQRAKSCSGYCNVNTEHMISLQRSLTLKDSYLFDVLQLKCPAQEGSAHPLVACSIFRSSMGGREDFSAIFTVTFSSHWPGAHGKKLEKTNNEQ